MYKKESEEKLLKQVNLSELTAVNILKDPKGRREHTFGLFTPSHNYRFQAGSDREARDWVDLIRKEARIDEEEETIIFGSPTTTVDPGFRNFGQSMDSNRGSGRMMMSDRLASSSPEPSESQPQGSGSLLKGAISRPRKQSVNEYDYSGQEQASYSDFSDAAPQSLPRSSYNPPRSLPIRPLQTQTPSLHPTTVGPPISTTTTTHQDLSQSTLHQTEPSTTTTNTNTTATTTSTTPKPDPQDPSHRILWQGYLLALKSTRGVRQWKRLWAVLRPAHLAFYKTNEVSESLNPPLPHPIPSHSTPNPQIPTKLTPISLFVFQEYATYLLLPLSTILSAIEIDPLSRSKAHCMQVIAEERNYRFCAESEDQLARCLGGVKSLLAARRKV